MKPVLIVDLTSKDALRSSEFINPLKKAFPKAKVIHYSILTTQMASKSKGIILSGTTLTDHEYLKKVKQFNFLKKYPSPVLGICAGQQIIGIIFGSTIHREKKPEIGLIPIYVEQSDEILDGYDNTFSAYTLHQSNISLPKNFIRIAHSNEYENAIIKHEKKPIYGLSFHPEVRNQLIFKNFEKIIQENKD